MLSVWYASAAFVRKRELAELSTVQGFGLSLVLVLQSFEYIPRPYSLTSAAGTVITLENNIVEVVTWSQVSAARIAYLGALGSLAEFSDQGRDKLNCSYSSSGDH